MCFLTLAVSSTAVPVESASEVTNTLISGGFENFMKWFNLLADNWLMLLAILTPIMGAISIYYVRKKRCENKLERDYANAVSQIKKCYIHSRGQNVNPTNFPELSDNNGPVVSRDLLSHFIKIAFTKKSSRRYFMVLADSGMGKTTFLVRLYMKYMLSLFKKDRKNMEIVYLGRDDCLQVIKQIKDPNNTILLLDALDEHRGVISREDADSFLKNLLNTVEPFYKVLITCRSQYFISEDREPSKMPFMSADTGRKEVQIDKLYLSPFSVDDTEKYIKKVFYGKERDDARAVIKKIPTLTARPLILSYLQDLIGTGKRYTFSVEIYADIIDKWLKREANELIRDLDGNELSNSLAYDKLKSFTYELAMTMYRQRKKEISLDIVDQIAVENENVHLQPFVAQGRSLITRNSVGGFKFAHQSFYEFILSDIVSHRLSGWDEIELDELSQETIEFIGYWSARKIIHQEFDGIYVGLNFQHLVNVFPNKSIRNVFDLVGRNMPLGSLDFQYANFEEADLEGVVLWGANLERANLERANLERANLERANLKEANLKEANLKEANLERANLERANLERANLERAILSAASLWRTNLKDTVIEW